MRYNPKEAKSDKVSGRGLAATAERNIRRDLVIDTKKSLVDQW